MKNINKLTNGLDSENSIFLSQIKDLDTKLHQKYDNSDSTIAELFRRADEKMHQRYPSLEPEDAYSQDYLTFIALEDGTISFDIWKDVGTEYITSISYSTDGGETWNTTNNIDNKTQNLVITVNVSEGDNVMWKGSAIQLGFYDRSEDAHIGSFFSSTCKFNAQGNVMSMLYGDNYKNQITIENKPTFPYLFTDYEQIKTCGIVNAKNLSLPATTLADYCYQGMFYGCTNLTTAPSILPAITLANYCYSYMFYGCTNLTVVPELPATTLAHHCYDGMFVSCASLTTAPALPATTLTMLTEGCYQYMFEDCTSLTTAPVLPATTLAQYCYRYMFSGCTSLNSITCLATDISANYCTQNWVSGVASTGTFVKAASVASWTTGNNGIPTNWTVQNAS